MPECSNKECSSRQTLSDTPSVLCPNCKETSYCCTECQLADSDSHKSRCGLRVALQRKYAEFAALPMVPDPSNQVKPEDLEQLTSEDVTIRIDRSDNAGDEEGLITTVKASILVTNKKVGNVDLFIVPAAVGRTGEYFEIMDALNQDLSTFAYRCTSNQGFFKDRICTYGSVHHWNRSDSRNMAYIDEILIEEPLRGHVIGTWAIQRLIKMYEKKVTIVATQPALLTHCEPLLRTHVPNPTKEQEEAFEARRDSVFRFFSKSGFRRLGNTEFYAFATNPGHPSRKLSAADDPPFKKVEPPQGEQEETRFTLMNNFMPYGIGYGR